MAHRLATDEMKHKVVRELSRRNDCEGLWKKPFVLDITGSPVAELRGLISMPQSEKLYDRKCYCTKERLPRRPGLSR